MFLVNTRRKSGDLVHVNRLTISAIYEIEILVPQAVNNRAIGLLVLAITYHFITDIP